MPDIVKKIFLNYLANILCVNRDRKFPNSDTLDRKYDVFKAFRRKPIEDRCLFRSANMSNLVQFSHDTKKIQRTVQTYFNSNTKSKTEFNGDHMFLTNKILMDCLEDVVNNINTEIETRIVMFIFYVFTTRQF